MPLESTPPPLPPASPPPPPPSPGPEDDELFVSLLAGEHSRLLGYIRTLVPHRQDAEDLFQKVSVVLWQKFGEFERGTNFLAWACRIAFLTVCNHRRSLYRKRLTFSQELLDTLSRERIGHLEGQGTRLDFLVDCLERLPTDDQSLLMQTYAGEAPIQEIASRTGKAVQTLYNRLALLRRDLMNCVQRKVLFHQT